MSKGLANGCDHSQTSSGKGLSEAINMPDILQYSKLKVALSALFIDLGKSDCR